MLGSPGSLADGPRKPSDDQVSFRSPIQSLSANDNGTRLIANDLKSFVGLLWYYAPQFFHLFTKLNLINVYAINMMIETKRTFQYG
jgi:hypothetical protein